MAHQPWRLLIDPPLDGATNMARDAALLAAQANGIAPPTLRLYQWLRPYLSLGRFQRSTDVHIAACASAGVGVVRRPSGGRALLHDAEVTYAIASRADHPLVGSTSIQASYQRISLALLAGLRRLGVAAELAPQQHRRMTNDRQPTNDQQPTTSDQRPATSDQRPTTDKHAAGGQWSFVSGHSSLVSSHSSFVSGHSYSSACYANPASYELVVGGRKLVGSAQARTGAGLLQHGAVPLAPHAARLAGLLTLATPDLATRMVTLGEVLPQPPATAAVLTALVAGFAETWGVELLPGNWAASELEHAAVLCAEQYANPAWTFGR